MEGSGVPQVRQFLELSFTRKKKLIYNDTKLKSSDSYAPQSGYRIKQPDINNMPPQQQYPATGNQPYGNSTGFESSGFRQGVMPQSKQLNVNPKPPKKILVP